MDFHSLLQLLLQLSFMVAEQYERMQDFQLQINHQTDEIDALHNQLENLSLVSPTSRHHTSDGNASAYQA